MREREAASVAAAVRAAVDERWQVRDGEDAWRDARLGDICILLPARTSLVLPRARARRCRHLLPGRDELARVRHAARSAISSYALRAVDDPSDELALGRARCARRSSAAATTTSSSSTWSTAAGGTSGPSRPATARRRITRPASAMRYLGALHRERTWVSPSELLERLVRERQRAGGRRRFAGASATSRGASGSWSTRRGRSATPPAARCATTSRGPTLQGTEGARVVETVLPETDDDAVRIMTIHGAKGLEFPIVICSGATTRAQREPGRRPGAVPAGRRLRGEVRRRTRRPTRSSSTRRSTSR